MRPATIASALLSVSVLLGASPLASAQVPDFCYEFNDQDGDRYVYGRTGLVCPREDCNDNDPNVHPTATEVCGDNVDQDCDGFDLPCPGADDDRDGFLAVSAGGQDCDDRDPSVHPGVTEVCGDGKDNDCAGGDQACATDADHDGHGNTTDCNDNDASVHPHAAELCGDGVDQDCAGGDPSCVADADGDGRVALAMGGDDCDDFDRATHPGAEEVCGDGRDQNCDGDDPHCAGPDPDGDRDGHLVPSAGGDDCDDDAPDIHPGANEICGDGLDQDCNGLDLSCTAQSGDADGDGHLSPEAGGDDCDDGDAASYPGAPEVCADGRDQNCDLSDATPGVSPDCQTQPTTNAAFEAIRERSVVRHNDGPTSCRSLGGGGSGELLLLLGLSQRRRRRP